MDESRHGVSVFLFCPSTREEGEQWEERSGKSERTVLILDFWGWGRRRRSFIRLRNRCVGGERECRTMVARATTRNMAESDGGWGFEG